jgi:hypothetical protein
MNWPSARGSKAKDAVAALQDDILREKDRSLRYNP